MNNMFIIRRAHYQELKEYASDMNLTWPGITHRTMALLHFYIIENDDGSAEFIKNRSKNKIIYDPAEYKEFKREYMN